MQSHAGGSCGASRRAGIRRTDRVFLTMTAFTETELRELAHEARNQYTDTIGKCWEVCHTFGNLLIDNGLPKEQEAYEVEEFRVGENDEENHFLFKLPGQYAEGVDDDETIWVDLSLGQFCDVNADAGSVEVSLGPQEDIEPVYIYYPGDERRERYTTVGAFLEEGLS